MLMTQRPRIQHISRVWVIETVLNDITRLSGVVRSSAVPCLSCTLWCCLIALHCRLLDRRHRRMFQLRPSKYLITQRTHDWLCVGYDSSEQSISITPASYCTQALLKIVNVERGIDGSCSFNSNFGPAYRDVF